MRNIFKKIHKKILKENNVKVENITSYCNLYKKCSKYVYAHISFNDMDKYRKEIKFDGGEI